MTFNQKELSIIKLDVIKNQELLTEVIDRSRLQVIENSFDRSTIDIPLLNMDQLNALEENDEQKRILVSYFLSYNLCFHCFDQFVLL